MHLSIGQVQYKKTTCTPRSWDKAGVFPHPTHSLARTPSWYDWQIVGNAKNQHADRNDNFWTIAEIKMKTFIW